MRPSVLASLTAVLLWTAAACADDAGSLNALQQRGRMVFDHWCYACHKPLHAGDRPVAGTSSLQRRYEGSEPAALEQRTDLSPAYIKHIVRTGDKSMPPSRKTEISDADLDALAAYLTHNNR